MMIRRAVLLALICLLPLVSFAAPVKTCKELKKLKSIEISSGYATADAIFDCLERGEDPPLSLRSQMGKVAIVTPVGNSYPRTPCRPGDKHQCPNNRRVFTDGSGSPSGYDPASNPKLKIPELPWGDLNDREIPCGAVATLAGDALQSLMGKAKVKSPISLAEVEAMIDEISIQINNLNTVLQGLVFGSYTSQQAKAQLGIVNNKIKDLLSKTKAGGGLVQKAVDAALSAINNKSNKLIDKHNTLPPGEVNTLLSGIASANAEAKKQVDKVKNLSSVVDDEIGKLAVDIKKKINGKLTGLIGKFFKHRNCQDGSFWGILNGIINLVMGKGKYIYDVSNNTFISPNVSTLVTLPTGTTIGVTPNLGGLHPIILPNGGSFVDAKGYKVNLARGTIAKFRTDGLVKSSNGSQYRVNPSAETVLDPHGVLEIPPGTRIPVDPKSKVYPVSPITKMPDWLNEGYAKAAEAAAKVK